MIGADQCFCTDAGEEAFVGSIKIVGGEGWFPCVDVQLRSQIQDETAGDPCQRAVHSAGGRRVTSPRFPKLNASDVSALGA